MYSSSRSLLAALTLLVATVSAHAAPAAPPVYAGLGVGQSSFAGETATAVRGYLGWQPISYVAVELGGTSLGTAPIHQPVDAYSTLDAHLDGEAYDLSLLAITPRWKGLSAFARGGVAESHLHGDGIVSFTGFPPGGPHPNFVIAPYRVWASQSGTHSTYGFGAQLELPHQLFVRGEWQEYTDVGGTGESAHNSTLSLAMRF